MIRWHIPSPQELWAHPYWALASLALALAATFMYWVAFRIHKKDGEG